MPISYAKLTAQEINYAIQASEVHALRLNGKPGPIIGQDRAVSALELGLGIRSDGYNIFIMGASGTGRRTVLTSLLKDYKPNPSELQDIAYAYNFTHPNEPRALCFPAGTGAYFRKTLQSAIESIRKQALQLGKSEVFSAASKKIISAADAAENQMLAEFDQKMAVEGFKLLQIKENDSSSMDLIPLIRGKPVSFEDLQILASRGKFPPEQLQRIRENYYTCLDQLSELFNTVRQIHRQTDKQIRALKATSALPIIENELAVLKSLCEKEPRNADVLSHLNTVQEDLLARIHLYSEPFKSPAHKKHFFGRYALTLVCEQGPDKNYIIQEEVPTFSNLFGSIEPHAGRGDTPDHGHLRLRPGAVHRAAGGILVLRLQDLLLEEGAWPYLKRVLQSGKIEIQSPPGNTFGPSLLKPQPIPVKLKVLIIGGEHSYDFLYQEDPDFQKLFKVCAEFDSVMPKTDDNMAKLIAFTEDYISRNNLLPIDDPGIAAIITQGIRLSDYRNRITTRFTLIADLLIEADYQARSESASTLSAAHVARALAHRRYLQCLPEEKFAEMISTRELLVDVVGEKIGKVNGLAVHDRGYHAFGITVAVTAQAAPGNTGVINIEGESGLSGEIYDKAHLIIQGLLHRMYARDIPLAISASICFEQSYTEVDGDSASCAELFSLLSAIAGIPLRQDIAVTGSVNQHGDVQPVGGIPEKIEGFFDACSILGLTGKQGVIIPRRNINNVLLAPRIETAIREGQFHIWAITSVDEGLEILSGTDHAVFNERVRETLEKYAARMQKLFS